MYYTSIPEKIKISQCNGAKVRILTEIKHGKVISLLNKFNANEIRMHSLPSKARVIVEKDRILVMSGAIDDINLNGDTENSICTDCPEMIDSMYALYDRLWDKAKQTNKKR